MPHNDAVGVTLSPIEYAKLIETTLHQFFSEVRLDAWFDGGAEPPEWLMPEFHSEVRDPVSAFHWEHISPSKYPAAKKKAESDYSGTITSVNVGSWVFTDVNGGVCVAD